jgi:hypothetical protein
MGMEGVLVYAALLSVEKKTTILGDGMEEHCISSMPATETESVCRVRKSRYAARAQVYRLGRSTYTGRRASTRARPEKGPARINWGSESDG